MVWFGLVWSIHRQTNKLNIYFILINQICEFVCGFHRQTNKLNIYFISINLICEFVCGFHRQTNKLNIYFILINLICEFVCGFCGQEKKKKKNRLVYRVAAQLKIGQYNFHFLKGTSGLTNVAMLF